MSGEKKGYIKAEDDLVVKVYLTGGQQGIQKNLKSYTVQRSIRRVSLTTCKTRKPKKELECEEEWEPERTHVNSKGRRVQGRRVGGKETQKEERPGTPQGYGT